MNDLNAMLTDARYALCQCRNWNDAGRAGDALERVVERLERLLTELKPTEERHEDA